MPILNPDDHYPSIRRAIAVDLDAEALPDVVIEDPIYLGAAEAEILRRVPNAASATGEDRRRIVSATILLTASLLAPAIPRIVEATLGDFRFKRDTPSWSDVAADQRIRAQSELNAVGARISDPIEPVVFTAVRGRRRGPW